MSRTVKTQAHSGSEAREPLVAALADTTAARLSRWQQAEAGFLAAMCKFDEFVASGRSTQGDRQNGKGDYFNDLLALLLSNCSGKDLHTRPNIPGLSFKNNKLDVAYPRTGPVRLLVETKATGIPKHPGNTKQPHQDGRAGSADLEKRIKEAAFKNIDIKAEAAREEGKGGGATSDLASWMQAAPPRCYLFLSVRVRDNADLAKAISYAHIGSTWFDACGLFAYGWNREKTAYEAKEVGASSIELDRVLSTVCTALRSLD